MLGLPAITWRVGGMNVMAKQVERLIDTLDQRWAEVRSRSWPVTYRGWSLAFCTSISTINSASSVADRSRIQPWCHSPNGSEM
uniref:hypothetical protein n=1 Tax=Amycolatopsis thermoflava TaxID=84480 RepID=UPI0038CC0B6A